MAQVSVIGLGAMGSTLAMVLAESGHQVTAWNRSPLSAARAETLGRAGVSHVAAPATAIAASPLAIMCVLDYAAADSILDGPGVREALVGRTLVQLTNGSEDEVRRQLELVQGLGGRMLCGGIVGYPRHIGRHETAILYAGSETAFAEHKDTLAALAGEQRFLGEDPAVQNATYAASFGFYFCALMGFLENAALAASRGVAPADFAAKMPAMTALLLDHMADATRRIAAGDYEGDQATVDVHLVGARWRARAFVENGLQSLISDGYAAYCQQAHDVGEGDQDIAAIYKRIVAPPEP